MKIPSVFKLRDWGSDDAPTVPVADGHGKLELLEHPWPT